MNYAPLTPKEVMDLTCMQAGVPWNCQAELVELFAIYDKLRSKGQRPFDPASLPETEHDAYWEAAAAQAPAPAPAVPAGCVQVVMTFEQVQALYLTLMHGRRGGKEHPETRPAFGWMEQPLVEIEKTLEPVHSAIHDRQFNSLNRQFFGDDSRRLPEADLKTSVSASPAVGAETPAGVVVSAYRIGDDINAIRVERAQQIDGPDLWAVRRHGDVLNRSGEWEWEPMPSSRDDEFLVRCRFSTHTEAIAAAMSKPPVQPMGGA